MKKLLKRIVMGMLTGALMFGALGTDLGTVNVEAKTKVYKLDNRSQDDFNRHCYMVDTGWASDEPYSNLVAKSGDFEVRLSAKSYYAMKGTCQFSCSKTKKQLEFLRL